MMAALTWGPELCVGFGDIDAQHRRLVELLGELEAAHIEGRGRDHVGQVIDGLARYTRLHFAFEEKLMARHGIEDPKHVAAHARLADDVEGFAARYAAGQEDLGDELLAFLGDWLRIHIGKDDRELARALQAAGATSAA